MTRILVVDDEPMIADLIERFLKMAGFQAYKAIGGEEAIRVLESHEQFDLMVLDVKMPKASGLSVMQRKSELKKEFPVFLLTGTIDEQKHLEELGRFGVRQEDILYKPIDFTELIEKIKHTVRAP